MSTNKTPNYQFHTWEAADHFLRTEFNENFAKIDAEAVRIIFGVYTGKYDYGAATTTRIDLGAKPRAVMVVPDDGSCANAGGSAFDAIAAPGVPAAGNTLTLDGTGFSVSNSSGEYIYLNVKNKKYYYIAFL